MSNWFTRLFNTDPREEVYLKVRVRENGKNSFIIEEKFRSLNWDRVSRLNVRTSYSSQEEAEKAAEQYFKKENAWWQEWYGNQEDRKRNRKVVKVYE